MARAVYRLPYFQLVAIASVLGSLMLFIPGCDDGLGEVDVGDMRKGVFRLLHRAHFFDELSRCRQGGGGGRLRKGGNKRDSLHPGPHLTLTASKADVTTAGALPNGLEFKGPGV